MGELAGVVARGSTRGATREATPDVPARLPGLSAARTQAYVDCFREHFPRLAGYCATMVGDPHLGHELAQEAFARLFGKWVGVREPKAYVYLVATNLAREHWRRQRFEATAYADVARLERDEVAAPDLAVRDLVERLPGRQREAVLLRYYADLPVAEVADLMKLPEGTVKRLLHEARNALVLAYGETR